MGSGRSSEIVECIRRAEQRRRSALGGRVQDAWRIVNGAGDDAPPALTIDRYGRWLVLAARSELGDDVIEAWARGAKDALEPDGLVVKVLRRPASASTSRVHSGHLPPGPMPIREADAVLLCDLDDGISTGLFLDLHDTRLAIRPHAADREVLNLFAHTCAFSVHAALGGARRVTSVDVSRKFLRRGRENMTASGLDPDRHRWFPDDVKTHLERAVRRGDRYGLVILDPPVFGRAGGKIHDLEQDLERLVHDAASIVEAGGTLVVAVHAVRLAPLEVRRTVDEAITRAGRSGKIIRELGLPEWDHPARPDVPLELDRGQYLKTLVLSIG